MAEMIEYNSKSYKSSLGPYYIGMLYIHFAINFGVHGPFCFQLTIVYCENGYSS